MLSSSLKATSCIPLISVGRLPSIYSFLCVDGVEPTTYTLLLRFWPEMIYNWSGVYDGVRRVLGLRREPVVSVRNLTLIPTSHWEIWSRPCHGRLRPACCEFCAGVLCTQLATRESESATTGSGSSFSVWCWDQWWGSPRSLQVPYVIPRPGVPRHIQRLCEWSEKPKLRDNQTVCGFYQFLSSSIYSVQCDAIRSE